MKNPFENFFEKPKIKENKIEYTDIFYRQLELKDLNKIFFQSFSFSQGDIELQLLFLTNSFKYYGKQNMSDDIVNILRKSFVKKNINIDNGDIDLSLNLTNVNTHPTVDKNLIYEEIKPDGETSMFDSFVKCMLGFDFEYKQYHSIGDKVEFAVIKKIEIEDKLKEINFIETVLDLDLKYLIIKQGRENRLEKNIGSNTLKDRYFSFFVNYIIRDNKVGEDSFDLLISKLKDWIKNNQNKKIIEKLKILLEFYNIHHPNTPVTEQELLSVGIKL